jgi:hypothetical protein
MCFLDVNCLGEELRYCQFAVNNEHRAYTHCPEWRTLQISHPSAHPPSYDRNLSSLRPAVSAHFQQWNTPRFHQVPSSACQRGGRLSLCRSSQRRHRKFSRALHGATREEKMIQQVVLFYGATYMLGRNDWPRSDHLVVTCDEHRDQNGNPK